jgi:ribosome silencing factor RsfS/YbeB/iojap
MARTPKSPEDSKPRRKPAASRVPGKAATLRTPKPTGKAPASKAPASKAPAARSSAPKAPARKPAARSAAAPSRDAAAVPRAARSAAASKSAGPKTTGPKTTAPTRPARTKGATSGRGVLKSGTSTARAIASLPAKKPRSSAISAARSSKAKSAPALSAKARSAGATASRSPRPAARVSRPAAPRDSEVSARPARAPRAAVAAKATPPRTSAATRQARVFTPKPTITSKAATPVRGASAPAPAAKAPKAAAPKPKRVKLTPPQIERLVQATVASLEDDKAENIVVLDVASRAAFADRMVIATGLVERQITAMATHIEKALAELGLKRLRIESSPDWVLLDAGDLVVHLFKPEARDNYRLEKMWGPDSPVGTESAENMMPQRGGTYVAETADSFANRHQSYAADNDDDAGLEDDDDGFDSDLVDGTDEGDDEDEEDKA